MHKLSPTMIAAGVFFAIIAFAVVVAVFSFASFPSRDDPQSNTSVDNTDPKNGPVFVRTVDSDGRRLTTVKYCDGTTLVYNFLGGNKDGGAVVVDSKECQG